MIKQFFLERIKKNFPHEPTPEQEMALDGLSEFIFDTENRSLFLLKGYAGTGKSSLVGAIVRTMAELDLRSVLLAPTGRAAKVFSAYGGQTAYTIHKKIYRQRIFTDQAAGFSPADNLHRNTLFIVDEASMISNDGLDSFLFGSGRLLDDLIRYVYSGSGCRLILLGDSAQLPPVSQTESPALDVDTLSGYGLQVEEVTLTQIVRQAQTSGILFNATKLRRALTEGRVNVFPQIVTDGFPDVEIISGNELVDALEEAYDRSGIDETIVITRSNKQAKIFNNGIRNRVLFHEDALSIGDLLMVAKNNYYWNRKEDNLDFIANGDLIEVVRIRKEEGLYGFHFADLTVRFPDYGRETDLKVLTETLHTDLPGLPKEMSDRLFQTIFQDCYSTPIRSEKMKQMKENPYFNALQIKYAYAVTCHKAQGGQWKNVFLDLSYMPKEYLDRNFYRWLYTAFTRATEKLYLIANEE